jgi:hypothetical protein
LSLQIITKIKEHPHVIQDNPVWNTPASDEIPQNSNARSGIGDFPAWQHFCAGRQIG